MCLIPPKPISFAHTHTHTHTQCMGEHVPRGLVLTSCASRHRPEADPVLEPRRHLVIHGIPSSATIFPWCTVPGTHSHRLSLEACVFPSGINSSMTGARRGSSRVLVTCCLLTGVATTLDDEVVAQNTLPGWSLGLGSVGWSEEGGLQGATETQLHGETMTSQ